MLSRQAHFCLLLACVALLAAALACNLQVGDTPAGSTLIPSVTRPTVEILEPAEGARFNRGTTISVRARASGASGVTVVRLTANGIEVDSQTPAESINPNQLDVLLDYKVEQVGTVTLAVTAYSGTVAGQPALRTVQVVDPLNPGQGGQPGTTVTYLPPSPTQYNPLCRARINTGLNFRRGPGIVYDKLGTIPAGLEAQITGYADQSDGRWWQVAWSGQSGWVSAAYTTQLGDCSAIRPVGFPAPPTAIPSVTPIPTQPGRTATPTLPDLYLTALDGVSDVTLGTDGKAQATYTIRVRNNGGQMSNQFQVAIGLPNNQVQLIDVPGLNPGQEMQVPGNGLTVTFDSPGTARILVTVDSNNTVAESNEQNNQAYKDITVRPNPNPTAAPPPTAQPTPEPTIAPTADTSSQNVPPADQGEAIPQVEAGAQNTGGTTQVISAGNAGGLVQLAVLQGHGGTITGLAFSPQGDVLASSSLDGTVRLWNVAQASEWHVLTGHTDRVMAVAFSPDGSRVVSAGWDGTVRLWDVASGTEITRFERGIQFNHVDISYDGSLIAAGGENPAGGGDGLAIVWDVASGSPIAEYPTGGVVTGVALYGTNRLAVATRSPGCDNPGGGVTWFDVPDTGGSIPLGDISGSAAAVAISPSGALIAATGQQQLCAGSGVAWVWETAGNTLLYALDHGSAVPATGVAFSPDDGLLVSGSEDSAARVWDMGSGALLATLSGHSSAVNSIAFSPAGTTIASGGTDSTVRLWGVP